MHVAIAAFACCLQLPGVFACMATPADEDMCTGPCTLPVDLPGCMSYGYYTCFAPASMTPTTLANGCTSYDVVCAGALQTQRYGGPAGDKTDLGTVTVTYTCQTDGTLLDSAGDTVDYVYCTE